MAVICLLIKHNIPYFAFSWKIVDEYLFIKKRKLSHFLQYCIFR